MFASKDAATTVMAARSLADNGIDVDDPAAAGMSSDNVASSMLENRSAIKMKPRILVFRRFTRYYNSVWAITISQ